MTHSGSNIHRALPNSFRGTRRGWSEKRIEVNRHRQRVQREFREKYPLERHGNAKWILVEVDGDG